MRRVCFSAYSADKTLLPFYCKATIESNLCVLCVLLIPTYVGKLSICTQMGSSMTVHAYAPNELPCFHSLMQRSFLLIHAGFRH